jgi:hypothetical protein
LLEEEEAGLAITVVVVVVEMALLAALAGINWKAAAMRRTITGGLAVFHQSLHLRLTEFLWAEEVGPDMMIM